MRRNQRKNLRRILGKKKQLLKNAKQSPKVLSDVDITYQAGLYVFEYLKSPEFKAIMAARPRIPRKLEIGRASVFGYYLLDAYFYNIVGEINFEGCWGRTFCTYLSLRKSSGVIEDDVIHHFTQYGGSWKYVDDTKVS